MLGDGGVMFTVAELATAAELGIALPVVVVDNSGYGEIRNEMAERGDPVHAVTFPAPDFAALGRAVGCHGVTVDLSSADPAEVTTAVRDALVADRPTVIHVRMPHEGVARMSIACSRSPGPTRSPAARGTSSSTPSSAAWPAAVSGCARAARSRRSAGWPRA